MSRLPWPLLETREHVIFTSNDIDFFGDTYHWCQKCDFESDLDSEANQHMVRSQFVVKDD